MQFVTKFPLIPNLFLGASLFATLSLTPSFAQQATPTTSATGAPGGAGLRTRALPIGVQVLGLETRTLQATSSSLILSHDESAEGIDWNSDGDMEDFVLYTYDSSSGLVTNHSVALGYTGYGATSPESPTIEGDTVLLKVGESEGGIDLNGDGDISDNVYHVYDAASGVLTNTQYTHTLEEGCCIFGCGCPRGTDIEGPWVAIQAWEGRVVSLNFDGDSIDNCPVLVNAATGQIINPQLAGDQFFLDLTRAKLSATLALLPVYESTNNGDINGDGDSSDSLIAIVELQTSAVTIVDAFPVFSSIASFDGGFVFCIAEGLAVDLNQDGDMNDFVLHVYDHGTGLLTNLAVAVTIEFTNITKGDSIIRQETADSIIRVHMSELQQGQDLNGDGDTADDVLAFLDPVTQQLTNTGLAMSSSVSVVDSDLSGSFAVALMSEAGQGGTDFNGDGDALDQIPVLFDGASKSMTILPVAASSCGIRSQRISEGLLPICVSEAEQGSIDLNGDGDATDTILFSHDLETLASVQLPYAVAGSGGILVDSEFLFYIGDESASSVDLNGDGDDVDRVWVAMNRVTLETKSLRLLASSAVLLDGSLVLNLSEVFEGYDFNGDGVLSESLLVQVDPRQF